MSQSLTIQVVPKVETCYNFSQKVPASIVLAPIRVFSEDGKIIIAFACSLSNECDFDKCFYRRIRKEAAKRNHDFGVNLHE